MDINKYFLLVFLAVAYVSATKTLPNDTCGTVEPRKIQNSTIALFAKMKDVEAWYGGDPWHAAIYRKQPGGKKVLICGATIISPRVLVSAAHCFFNEALGTASNDTSNYEIYVGKFTRTYSKLDAGGKYQKIHQIEELIDGPYGYNPTHSCGSDIILITLKVPVTFNTYVRPTCVDWDGSIFDGSYGNENKTGRVVGWGILNGGRDRDILVQEKDLSENLLVAKLSYVSYKNCMGQVGGISIDQFCGRSQSGTSELIRFSGGGFMFEYEGRFYLRGILSVKDYNDNSVMNKFTNVALHTSWIRKYL